MSGRSSCRATSTRYTNEAAKASPTPSHVVARGSEAHPRRTVVSKCVGSYGAPIRPLPPRSGTLGPWAPNRDTRSTSDQPIAKDEPDHVQADMESGYHGARDLRLAHT